MQPVENIKKRSARAKPPDNLPKHWFHVSRWSPSDFKRHKLMVGHRTFLFSPISSESAYFRAIDEPDTPRICVAPTIWQAMLAAVMSDKKMYVYRTDEAAYMSPVPKRYRKFIPDLPWTGEHWLEAPAVFRFYGTVKPPVDQMDRRDLCNCGLAWYADKYQNLFKSLFENAPEMDDAEYSANAINHSKPR